MFPDLPPRIYEALKALSCLASSSKPLRAKEVAAATSLPPAQTAKILQEMTWAGFVDSRRGTKGGFVLRKPASRIRVTDVCNFFSHSPPNGEPKDPMLRVLAQATKACKKELAKITIADLAKVSTPKPAGSKSAGKAVMRPERAEGE